MQASADNLAESTIGTKRSRSVIESINIGNSFWKSSLKDCGAGKRQIFWDGSQGPVHSKVAERTAGCRELLNTRRAPSAASLNKFMEYNDAEASSMLTEVCAGLREVAEEVLPWA